MGANYPAMALVEVKGLVESAAKVEIETTAVVGMIVARSDAVDYSSLRMDDTTFVATAAAGAAAGIPLRPARAAISRAAERRGGLLKGGAPDALAVVNDHGRWTYAELDDFSGRIARLLVEEHGLIPGNRVLLRGPNGYTMFAAWLGVLEGRRRGGRDHAAAPPGRDRDGDRARADQPRDRRQPLHRRLPPGGRADALRQAHRQI